MTTINRPISDIRRSIATASDAISYYRSAAQTANDDAAAAAQAAAAQAASDHDRYLDDLAHYD